MAKELTQPSYRITKDGGRRVLAKPAPSDITTNKHGEPLTEKQIATRKRQLSINAKAFGKRTVLRGREYFAYLRSPEWADVKRRYHLSTLPKDCFVCRAPWQSNFHFHHRTYKNLGCEKLTDIVPVCPPCHENIHKSVKPDGKNLWKATTKARRNFAKGQRRMAAHSQPRGDPAG